MYNSISGIVAACSLHWMASEYGMDVMDAYQLVSQWPKSLAFLAIA